jgi:WD40 repeat protein/serine/threonine protein kinase
MGDPSPQAKAIFLAAIEDHAPEQWPSFLDQACVGEVPLRAEVEKLLRVRLEIGSFHEAPRSAMPATVDEPVTERPGTVIGPYKLLEQIGEGGFGVVFMAEQQQPIRRKVALKVLKLGMDTRQVIARFEAERQALALMDHANIARVFDGGETSGGRPYFVMELVKGVPITDYCDQSQFTSRERLELFLPVCQAVQHAHQKGVIHRDLKPSNILVTLHDGRPVPKVIDFGIAKATGQQLTDKTLFTNFAQLIGTPLYMSPEQAALSGLDLDTRSDIYSLGVLLYELLTGTTPFDKERFREAGYDELRRIIREEEPPRPSTRITTLGQAAMTVSTQRKSDPKQLSQLFRGELDWIVMKCLEKDRSRRYETANSVALDIGRYLNDEPVQACPPSAVYRFRKFARRHKGVLAAVALVTAALVLTVVVLAISNARVTTERDQKARALEDKDKALIQERAARDEAERAKKETELSLYLQTLARAQREREAGNVGLAESLLDDARFSQYRGWEWHYLKRLLYGSPSPLRHSSAMSGLALSSDGRLLAAGGNDGNVKLWDARTWEEVRTFHAHDQHIHRVAFAPGGRILATASSDGTVKIWDVATAAWLHTLKQGDVQVGTLVFSPEGRWLISGDSETVKVWDVSTCQPVRTLPGQIDAGQAMAMSPDGRCLAVGNNRDDTIQLWDTAGWTRLRTLGPHTGLVLGLAFRADGAQLAAACGQFLWNGREGEIKIWDVTTAQPVRTLRGHIGGAFSVAFAPDGLRLASGGVEDAVVKLWDVTAGRETLTLRGHSDAVWGVVFSPDGRHLYSSSVDHTVRGWDATPVGQGERLGGRTLRGQGGMVTSVAFSPDNRYLAAGGISKTIKVWDILGSKTIHTLTGHTGPVRGLAFSPDGRRLASASTAPDEPPEATGELKVWDTKTWLEIARLGPMSDDSLGVAFSTDGRRLATVVGSEIVVWDTDTKTRLLTLRGTPGFSQIGVAFGPEGRLASCGIDGTVHIWNVSSGEEAIPFTALVPPAPVLGHLVAVWRATTRLPVRVLAAHEGRAMSVAFSPDGNSLASAGLDGAINFWDAKTFQPIHTLRGHLGGVHCLAFRPDGKRLASAGADAAVRVWDVMTRRNVLTFRGHTSAIYTVAFSPDGRYLASGGWDETVRIWDADPPPEQRRWATADP